MKKRTYKWLPRTLEGLAPWFANFCFEIRRVSYDLGFVAAEFDEIQNDSAMVSCWVRPDGRRGESECLSHFSRRSLYGETATRRPLCRRPRCLLSPRR